MSKFILFTLILASFALADPKLAVTFHGGLDKGEENNILRYNIYGDEFGHELNTGSHSSLRSLRGFANLIDGSLLVLQAYQYDSKVLHFGKCDNNGMRALVGNFTVPGPTNPYLKHPYGIQVDNSHGYVFVSNQDTFSVTRYNLHDGSPAGLAHFPSGVFWKTKKHNMIRGIAIDEVKRLLFVAIEDDNAIWVLDADFGYKIEQYDFPSPVGLHFDVENRRLYAGSNSEHNYVKYYDLEKEKWSKKYANDKHLSHPAGMIVVDGILYVLSQDVKRLISFDVDSHDYKGTVVKSFSDFPEHINLDYCP